MPEQKGRVPMNGIAANGIFPSFAFVLNNVFVELNLICQRHNEYFSIGGV